MSAVPAEAKQPQDHLKPAVEREAEASTEAVVLEWHDSRIELPPAVEDWDPDTLEAFEAQKAITGLRLLVGSRRYDEIRAEFKAKFGRKPTIRDFTPLVEEIGKLYGFETTGNS